MKKYIRIAISLIIIGLPSCDGNFLDASKEQSTKIKKAVDAALAAADNKAGISVAVFKNGDSLWTYAAGCADCNEDKKVKMETSTPTFAYSITKTLVSALVLTQIANGDYAMNNTVDGLLSGNADYSGLSVGQKALLNINATVEQLLTHTSGMPNYADNLDALIPQCDPAASWKPADILENIVYLDDGPAGTFEYSNTNYILLGMIAEVEGSATLNTLLKNTFFTPLGLNLTLAPQDDYPLDIAHPYDDAYVFGLGLPVGSFMDFSTGIKILDPTYDIYTGIGRGTWAAGGIIATAEDLAIWGWELYDDAGTAISASVRTTLKNSATGDGEYGYGVNYYDFTYDDGTAGGTYGHGGGAPGYKTLLRYEKTKKISVAIITNENNTYDGTGLIDQEALAAELFNAYENN